MVGDLLTFEVPTNSDFSLSSDFMSNSTGDFTDSDGLVTTFGDGAFGSSQGNNILGNCTFARSAFYLSIGNNTLGNCTFGNSAFVESTGNNTLGDCTYGNFAFGESTGNNTVGSILLTNAIFEFARNYSGTMNILGNIGTDETAEYLNFFTTSNAIINVLDSKENSNAGGIEGDLQTAITNGATVNFTL